MSSDTLLDAQQRLERLVRQRPAVARIRDVPATALWEGGGRTCVLHPDGNGAQVSPGWLLRAALASCAVTRIAMLAAERGMQPERLEADVTSETDLHGLLGLCRADGQRVPPGPLAIHLRLRIRVPNVEDRAVRDLVEQAMGVSPVLGAMTEAVVVRLDIDSGAA